MLLSLQTNGLEEIDKLYQYIRFDIERFGMKLHDVKRRLGSYYHNLVENDFETNDDDLNIEENEEHIIRFYKIISLIFFTNIP